MQTLNDYRVLDCGHRPGFHSNYTTGTVHTPDNREICWTCGNREERETMYKSNNYFAYLSSDGKTISTWPGGILARVTALWSVKHNWTGKMYRINAIGLDGSKWYGSAIDKGMYCRLHKNKIQN